MARLTPELIATDCGIRLVYLHDRGAASGTFGINVNAGSSADEPGAEGTAHFVEHTIFKGTRRRSPWHIINRMEAIGATLEAYTNKDETVVYSVFPGNNAARAIELIADLASESQFPEREIEKERQVVLDEIDSYLDDPAEAIYDSFEEKLLAGTPWAHNILGSAATVSRLGSADCRRFLERYYTKSNIVAFYSGPQSAAAVSALVSRHFGSLRQGEALWRGGSSQESPAPFDIGRNLPCHQSHVLTGMQTVGIRSPRRYAVALLANMTGGPGMNSLLNVELREKRGLVYNVESSAVFFNSIGYMGVYFGCDAEDTALCRRLARDVFARIADGALTPRRIAAAKKQYLGQLSLDSRTARVTGAATAVHCFGQPVSQAETEEAIHAVTAADLADVAASFATASSLAFLPDSGD